MKLLFSDYVTKQQYTKMKVEKSIEAILKTMKISSWLMYLKLVFSKDWLINAYIKLLYF